MALEPLPVGEQRPRKVDGTRDIMLVDATGGVLFGVVLHQPQRASPWYLTTVALDVEEPIAAILTVNTVAHTVGAAWCGAMVGDLYGSRAVGVFAAVFTVLVLAVTRARELLLRRAGLIIIILAFSAAANLYGPWRADQDRTRIDVEHTFTKKGVFDLSSDRNVLIFTVMLFLLGGLAVWLHARMSVRRLWKARTVQRELSGQLVQPAAIDPDRGHHRRDLHDGAAEPGDRCLQVVDRDRHRLPGEDGPVGVETR